VSPRAVRSAAAQGGGGTVRERLAAEVRGWPQWAREWWIERSGILMDNGEPQDSADQRAAFWTRKEIRRRRAC
jgi:hypothetical protein